MCNYCSDGKKKEKSNFYFLSQHCLKDFCEGMGDGDNSSCSTKTRKMSQQQLHENSSRNSSGNLVSMCIESKRGKQKNMMLIKFTVRDCFYFVAQ